MVLVSAAAPEHLAAALEHCGAVACIPKPFDLDELLATVAGLAEPA